MRTFARRTVTAAAMLVTAVAAVVMVAATPASALPSNCVSFYGAYSPEWSGGFGKSLCSSGLGIHRVKLDCAYKYGGTLVRYGPWTVVGQFSTAYCPTYGYKPVHTSYQTDNHT